MIDILLEGPETITSSLSKDISTQSRSPRGLPECSSTALPINQLALITTVWCLGLFNDA
jgi:hypothetical protein